MSLATWEQQQACMEMVHNFPKDKSVAQARVSLMSVTNTVGKKRFQTLNLTLRSKAMNELLFQNDFFKLVPTMVKTKLFKSTVISQVYYTVPCFASLNAQRNQRSNNDNRNYIKFKRQCKYTIQ